VEELPSHRFTSEGVEWIVRLTGRTSTGSTSDPGAPLLHLTFYRAGDPLVAVRETLLPGTSIDDLVELDLSTVLSSARNVPSSDQPSGPPSTPVRRKGRE